jgi:outer membrane protein assembly factor BamB
MLFSGLGSDAAVAGADRWFRFRGPNGSGVGAASGLPAELGPERNVAWRTEVPFGRSSPAVGTRQIFLTGIEEGALVVVAIDRTDGSVAWRAGIDRGHTADLHRATDSATPSPVTDGENVYAFFHEAGLVSFDARGKERWRKPLGPFTNYYGIAASPILAGDRLLMLCDQGKGSFLLAVDKETGKELWRRDRPARREAFTTPTLLADGSILVSGSRWVDAYDPATGKTLWSLGGVGTGPISSPVVDGDLLFVNSIDQASEAPPPFSQLAGEHDGDGDGEISRQELEGSWMQNHFPWINGDGKGGISAEDWQRHVDEVVNDSWGAFAIRLPAGDQAAKVVWNYRRSVPYISSPLVHEGVFYMVKKGILTSLDRASGELIKRGRLGDGSPEVHASLVAADGKLYVAALDGTVAVVELGGEWQVLGVNDLGEEIHATPAIAADRLLVRTRSSLYAFAAPSPAPMPAASGR